MSVICWIWTFASSMKTAQCALINSDKHYRLRVFLVPAYLYFKPRRNSMRLLRSITLCMCNWHYSYLESCWGYSCCFHSNHKTNFLHAPQFLNTSSFVSKNCWLLIKFKTASELRHAALSASPIPSNNPNANHLWKKIRHVRTAPLCKSRVATLGRQTRLALTKPNKQHSISTRMAASDGKPISFMDHWRPWLKWARLCDAAPASWQNKWKARACIFLSSLCVFVAPAGKKEAAVHTRGVSSRSGIWQRASTERERNNAVQPHRHWTIYWLRIGRRCKQNKTEPSESDREHVAHAKWCTEINGVCARLLINRRYDANPIGIFHAPRGETENKHVGWKITSEPYNILSRLRTRGFAVWNRLRRILYTSLSLMFALLLVLHSWWLWILRCIHREIILQTSCKVCLTRACLLSVNLVHGCRIQYRLCILYGYIKVWQTAKLPCLLHWCSITFLNTCFGLYISQSWNSPLCACVCVLTFIN